MKTANNHDLINAIRAMLDKDPIPGTSIPDRDRRDQRFVEHSMRFTGTGNSYSRPSKTGGAWKEEL